MINADNFAVWFNLIILSILLIIYIIGELEYCYYKNKRKKGLTK